MLNIFHAIVLFIVALLPHGGNVSYLTAKLVPTPTIVISSTSTPTPTPTVTIVETQALIQPTDAPTPVLQNCVINGQTYTLSPQDCQKTEDAIKGDQQIISNYQQSFKDYANDQSKIWSQTLTPIPTMDVSQALQQNQQEQDASNLNIMQGTENMWAETCRQTKMQEATQIGQNSGVSGVEQSQEGSTVSQAQVNMNGTFTLGWDALTQNGIQFGLVDQANQLIAQLKTACTL